MGGWYDGRDGGLREKVGGGGMLGEGLGEGGERLVEGVEDGGGVCGVLYVDVGGGLRVSIGGRLWEEVKGIRGVFNRLMMGL